MGAGAATIDIVLAADSWRGDPFAIVLVDGLAVFASEINAPHASTGRTVRLGEYDRAMGHQVTVIFTNDLWGGTPETDRNLHVKDILVDGISTQTNAVLTLTGSRVLDLDAGLFGLARGTPFPPSRDAPLPAPAGDNGLLETPTTPDPAQFDSIWP